MRAKKSSIFRSLLSQFSHSQITRLYSRFHSLDKGENGALSREDFQRIPELAINPLGDRIINAFFPEGVATFNNIVVFSYFFAVAFRLYDLDRDDKISRDELLQVRESCLMYNRKALHPALTRETKEHSVPSEQ
uniref:Calcineurin-like EF-hand protein 1 n=1 Tax=Sinocyclocheilus anshuiensis TaxID=1608454 RepID=A0A671KIQ2_9TELE